MKLITVYELENKGENELAALFHAVTAILTESRPGSAERCGALGSLENIGRARAARALRCG